MPKPIDIAEVKLGSGRQSKSETMFVYKKGKRVTEPDSTPMEKLSFTNYETSSPRELAARWLVAGCCDITRRRRGWGPGAEESTVVLDNRH